MQLVHSAKLKDLLYKICTGIHPHIWHFWRTLRDCGHLQIESLPVLADMKNRREMKSDVETAEYKTGFTNPFVFLTHLKPRQSNKWRRRLAGRDCELLTSCLSGLLQEVEQHAGGLVHTQLLRVLTAGLWRGTKSTNTVWHMSSVLWKIIQFHLIGLIVIL